MVSHFAEIVLLLVCFLSYAERRNPTYFTWATSPFGCTVYQMGQFTFAAAGMYAKIRLNKK